ncbi:ABC transporter permease [Sphingobacterium paludis]|uniref:ABC-type antimicrobial peptide transport system permease subunit n=1 Tax=Sphingobacterium paludis TaxID=1476465 RepID=A0A4R7D7U4_9SPHI|nr:ABC transporter permease [Sphingobacterium paludis]TDS15955.1 ABC-type antimicrobial peptide transport system permease subunit [Sphingobacterium paludis]
MLRNFLKTAVRYILKNKVITGINILSLAIGISATLVIFLLIQYDFSFDKNVSDRDRVYRLVSDGDFKNAGTLVPLVRTLETDLTGIESVVPVFKNRNAKIKVSDAASGEPRVFNKENDFVFTNKQYFDFYPHVWLSGSAASLEQQNMAILTDKDLLRYFPKSSAAEVLGKTFIFGDSIVLEIGGVVEEMAYSSDFKFSSFIAVATIPQYHSLKQSFGWDGWSNYSDANQCLVKLKAGTSPAQLEADILAFVSNNKKIDIDGWKDKFKLQPIADVHFNTEFNYSAIKPETLRNLLILALFLLSLGIINFVNLSTAQSIERAKEIGIRKTLGSSKRKLVWQFLTETFVVAFVATLLSILLLPLLLQAFDGFIPKGLTWRNIPTMSIGLFLFVQLILVTFLAGFYPAWVLTGYAPVLALKNQLSKNSNLSRSSSIRKTLTVFQFVLAQVFLVAVLVVSKQIQFATNKDMGFRKDAIINFYIPGLMNNSDKGKLLKTKLEAIPEIKALSFGNQSPAFAGWMNTTITTAGDTASKILTLDSRTGDENYLAVYNIPLVAGRNIRLLDTTSEALINEKALGLLNLKSAEDAIGLSLNGGELTVVGVMKDFDVASAHYEIRPLIYWGDDKGYVMHVALDQHHPENWKAAIDKIAKEYTVLFPDDSFEYKFLDETIAGFYFKEEQLSQLLRWAVALSVVIAGLGLFGLAIFTANQRAKEIGIRKVLGATIAQIVFLLLKNVLVLVTIACVIAFPIAWFLVNKWLQDFAYRTDISWWIFAASTLGLIGVATGVLLTRTLFAAHANPVNSLRDE